MGSGGARILSHFRARLNSKVPQMALKLVRQIILKVTEIGVRVTKTARPPVNSRMYLVFMNILKTRFLLEFGRPTMRLILLV